MANLKNKIKKLQTALLKNGYVVSINQTQFYSEDQNRMITQYHILTPVETFDEKKQKNVIKNKEILKSCSMIEVIKCLLGLYEEVSG